MDHVDVKASRQPALPKPDFVHCTRADGKVWHGEHMDIYAEAKRRRRVKAAKIQQVIDRFKELEQLYNDMEKLVGVDPEAPMFKVGYDLFNAYLDSVAENVGDQWTWLSWHIRENDCGANALEASWTENGEKITVSVRTPLQLVRVMEGHADR